ncbi:MAG: GtrA family protein, partial [Bryobacteraceae bacterium]
MPLLVALIPSYRPADALAALVGELTKDDTFGAVVVVDDGSGPEFADVFDSVAGMPRVRLLRHAVNLGKGAALKMGINAILCETPDCSGVVTADADGQHAVEDILETGRTLLSNPAALVLGSRRFSRDVPWRSRVGNRVTKGLFRILNGRVVSDTQTGLRGLPVRLLPKLLEIQSNRYEFELDALMMAIQLRIPFIEIPIQTLYFESNRGSHFSPLFDSARIYFVLTRFSVASLLTALLDNTVFLLAYRWKGNVAASQVSGRMVAMVFNYVAVRNAVFLSDRDHARTIPRYVALVAGSGFASYWILIALRDTLGIPTMYAKILAEGLLFLANFALQRDVVFAREGGDAAPKATDWDQYYRSVPPTAKVTRRYTAKRLLRALREHAPGALAGGLRITEFGGANSCFLDVFAAALRPARYRVIDTNLYGLGLLRNRTLPGGGLLELKAQDVLELPANADWDLVFSVGLIEHFDKARTGRAIRSHLASVRPGGVVLLTFPTPTWLYRVSRWFCERIGVWKFHDERPLERDEVVEA